jgi:hypothetical protein
MGSHSYFYKVLFIQMYVMRNVCFNLLIDDWFQIHNLIMKLKASFFFETITPTINNDFWRDNVWVGFLTTMV